MGLTLARARWLGRARAGEEVQGAGHVVLEARVRGLDLTLSAAGMHRRAINKGVTVRFML